MRNLEMSYPVPEKETQIYLEEGEVTEITPRIREIVEQIPGEGREFIESFFSWLEYSGYFKVEPDGDMNKLLNTEYLQRTADEIFASRYAIACAEKAVVLTSLCRAKGIPAKYVHAVRLDWLQQQDDDPMHLHAFVEVYLDNKWILVDPDPDAPAKMRIYEETNYDQSGYVKWSEGLDFRNLTDDEGNHRSWRSLQELKRDAVVFKQRWQKED